MPAARVTAVANGTGDLCAAPAHTPAAKAMRGVANRGHRIRASEGGAGIKGEGRSRDTRLDGMRATMSSVTLRTVPGLAEIAPGDDLARLIGDVLSQNDLCPRANDVLVVAQKIVSKAENRFVDLNGVIPGPRARELAQTTGKDARMVEVILSQSSEVVRAANNVLIVRHRLGHVMANAGVDRSNVPAAGGRELVLLLPDDPEGSARTLRARLMERFGVDLAVVISDSFGRPWRMGTVNVALGAAGLAALCDRRGDKDRQGRVLKVTQVAVADAMAAAAGLVMGEGAEGTPVVLVRGFECDAPLRDAASLVRPLAEDLFR